MFLSSCCFYIVEGYKFIDVWGEISDSVEIGSNPECPFFVTRNTECRVIDYAPIGILFFYYLKPFCRFIQEYEAFVWSHDEFLVWVGGYRFYITNIGEIMATFIFCRIIFKKTVCESTYPQIIIFITIDGIYWLIVYVELRMFDWSKCVIWGTENHKTIPCWS